MRAREWRREFISTMGFATAAALGSRVGLAQRRKVRIGSLAVIAPDATPRVLLDAFRRGLEARGDKVSQNLTIDDRWEASPSPAPELVRLWPDVIVARSTPAVTAKGATSTVLGVIRALALGKNDVQFRSGFVTGGKFMHVPCRAYQRERWGRRLSRR
jgi:hypothetical protein